MVDWVLEVVTLRRRGISVGVGPLRVWESWPVRAGRRHGKRRGGLAVLGVLALAGAAGGPVGTAILVVAFVLWLVLAIADRIRR
jgi:hypothetical protein